MKWRGLWELARTSCVPDTILFNRADFHICENKGGDRGDEVTPFREKCAQILLSKSFVWLQWKNSCVVCVRLSYVKRRFGGGRAQRGSPPQDSPLRWV